MNQNCKIKLSNRIILREIQGKIYINEVRKHTVMLMTSEALPILEYLQKTRTFEQFKKHIQELYETNDSIDEYCINFVNDLKDAGILEVDEEYYDTHCECLEKPTNNHDNKVELLEEAIQNNQLLSVTIELTYYCNLKCKHCFIGDVRHNDLDKHFYFRLIDDLYDMGALYIVFTGGEVFSRSDAIEIITYAVNKNFVVDIFTNGTLINDDLFKKLCDLNINSIQCSVYSLNEALHDDFVGCVGAFEKTTTILKKFSTQGINTAMKTCVFDFNYKELDAMKQYAQSIHASLQYTPTLMPRKDGKTTPNSYGVSIENLKESIIKNSDCYYSEREDDLQLCSAGQTSLSINPEGKVFMCNVFDLEVGDLTVESIQSVWKNSKPLLEFKNSTKEKREQCTNCTYKKYCDFCPGSAYKLTGSPFAKYETACIQAENIFKTLEN